MRAIPQKIQILKFVGEQEIVSFSDLARHPHKKYPDIPNCLEFNRIRTNFAETKLIRIDQKEEV